MSALIVKACGALTTIQDSGRPGYQRFGLSPAGAMDRAALAIANALVGNAPGEAAIEFAVFGGDFELEGGEAQIALAGADCRLEAAGAQTPPLTSRRVASGQSIRVGAARAGVFAYLAFAGGFAIPPMLGSRSVHVRAHIGGLDGRPLQARDVLPLGADRIDAPDLELEPAPASEPAPIRIVLGPQDDHFTPAAVETLLGSDFTVTAEADRMGYRLSGPPIEPANGFNIVSDGIVTGSIQVPGTRQPIVLLVDRQTTGGYPKIATIASADLTRFVQLRPGSTLRFAAILADQAAQLARAAAAELARRLHAVRPAGAASLDSARLLGLNLAGDAVDAAGDSFNRPGGRA